MSAHALLNALLVKLERDADYVVRDLAELRRVAAESGALTAEHAEAVNAAIVAIGLEAAAIVAERDGRAGEQLELTGEDAP